MDVRTQHDLILKAGQGDIEAFTALFEPLRPAALLVARRLVGGNDAEDVVMDAFLRAWKGIGGFHGRANLKTWIYRVVYNCAVDKLRDRTRHGLSMMTREDDQEEPETGLERLADPGAGPERRAEAGEAARIVARALHCIPPEHRTTLLLRYADEMSYSEIASATGVNIGTVMSRLFYGKKKLMAALGAMGIAGDGDSA